MTNPIKLIGTDRRYETWRWTTFGITWLIYFSFYLTRKTFSVAKVAFEDAQAVPQVTLTRVDYGIVDAAYLTTYAIGQFFWGPLGDRVGPRKILLLGLTLSIVAAVASGFSVTLTAFAAFAILQGIGQSTGWSNTVKTMSAWFSLHERGRVIGWWCTHYALGAVAALSLAAWLMHGFGTPRPPGLEGTEIVPYWPAAFWGTAACLAGVLLLVWFLLRDRPEDVGLPPVEEYHGEFAAVATIAPAERDSWADTILPVLKSERIWRLALAYFSIKLTRYAFYFWGPMYISESIGKERAGVLTSALTSILLPVGGVLGVIFTGYLSDRVFQSRRMPITVICLLLTAMTMMMGLVHIQQLWILSVFFFLIGFFLFGPDSIISGTAAMDFGTQRRAGTATGFINGVGSIGAILGGFLPGMLTSEADWSPIFYVFIGGLLFSAGILAPMWSLLPSDGNGDEDEQESENDGGDA